MDRFDELRTEFYESNSRNFDGASKQVNDVFDRAEANLKGSAREAGYHPKSGPRTSNPWRGVGEGYPSNRFTTPQGSKIGKKVSMGGFGVGMAIDTYMNMKQGDDLGTAAVKGAFTGMLWTTAPWVMGAMELGKAVPAMAEGYMSWKRNKEVWWNQQFKPNFGGNYVDTRRALTMRQAAVEAIQGSKLNARSALGGEAKLLHSNFNR